MSTVKNANPKLLKRNSKIRERYHHLTEVKHLASDWVLKILEDEFLPLERKTLWLIVTQTGYYKDL
ncbi:hypothetical protein MAR621_03141 [Maribacter dokdonensis]|uniref:hypothetical protein n=1 Tax=Maribacter dokdonensis TaxID=320912 RepID=UPI001AFF6AA9|nr:hypothetical protein [Maribacter dokdonensis]CAG2532947.1 hypothetical protein MAR621_03141 [Maribacter dokdonensis]